MTPKITVTGIDILTDIDVLMPLNAEIGILYSATPEGRNRYPSLRWIEKAADQLRLSCGGVALHICGSEARRELLQHRLTELVYTVGRVQVNGAFTCYELETLCEEYPNSTFITQHNQANLDLLSVEAPNHCVLLDSSGGRGLLPGRWDHIISHKLVGFAGGLGPENLAGQLPLIAAVAHPDRFWWVDMENSLRVNDWFSVEQAKLAVQEFDTWLESWKVAA